MPHRQSVAIEAQFYPRRRTREVFLAPDIMLRVFWALAQKSCNSLNDQAILISQPIYQLISDFSWLEQLAT